METVLPSEKKPRRHEFSYTLTLHWWNSRKRSIIMVGEENSTSRLIVKNLPAYITLDRLKLHFSSQGEVTDAKLAYSRNGTFRKFGYIGYKTNAQGTAAQAYFNGTYLDTCRISVEFAKAVGDTAIPRAWSKYTPGSSLHEAHLAAKTAASGTVGASKVPSSESISYVKKPRDVEQKKAKELEYKLALLKELYAGEENASKLQEFLEVMKPRSAARTWANDDVLPAQSTIASVSVTGSKREDDDDMYEDLPTSQIAIQSDSEEEEEENKATEIDAKITPDSDSSTPIGNIHPSRLAAMDAMDLSTATSINTPDVVIHHSQNEEDASLANPIDLIADTGRLFVRNLPFTCEEADLNSLFSPFGPLSEVHISLEKDSKKSKGFAFVSFMLPEHAIKAFTALDGQIFQGRILQILPGKENRNLATEALEADGRGNFKANRDAKKKSEAGSDINWNSLFMNSDAVADAMAHKLGVSKSDILDAQVDNMAVRMALAETHVINETKSYLEEEGVCLDAFSSGRKQRSDTVILVKNIPFRTEDQLLIDTFGAFGTLGRVVLPPARTIALVEFVEPSEAKVAFSKLAYSKFNGLPLFLEWAPTGAFKKAFDPAISKRKVPTVAQPVRVSENPADVEEDDDVDTATLFVKNLNFSTRDQALKDKFAGVSGLRSARVCMKVDRKTGKPMSMGFGFLEFLTKDEAMRCLKSMQNVTLDNHELVLKFSKSTTSSASKKSSSKEKETVISNGTKLIIRNIPFEATKTDLRTLFASFASVKSLRLPRKFDGTHRGFGFVEFLTKQEAKNAFETLSSTHLYGRHLVLEWANGEESVEALRARTAKTYFKDGGSVGGNKRKVSLYLDGDEDDESYD